MDDRRKLIRDLDQKRQDSLQFRAQTLENLGKSLADRLTEGDFPGGEGAACRRFRDEIADSEDSIKAIREALARIRNLDEEINVKNEEKFYRDEDLAHLYTRLGETALEEQGETASLGSFKDQLALVHDRQNSINERIRELETEGSRGIFGWFSRGIQGLVLRSSAGRNNKQIARIFFGAGRQYAQDCLEYAGEALPSGGALPDLLRDTLAMMQNAAELEAAAAVLKEEKAKIAASFGFNESPSRRIKLLEERVLRNREGLRDLYRRIGENAAGEGPLADRLEETEQAHLETADRHRRDAEEHSREMEKIEASVLLDKEKDALAKLERGLNSQKNRVADGEKHIGDFTKKIAEAQKRIDELRKKAAGSKE